MHFFIRWRAASAEAKAEKQALTEEIQRLPLEMACERMAEKLAAAGSSLKTRTYTEILEDKIAMTEDVWELETLFRKLFRDGNVRQDETEKKMAQWLGRRLYELDKSRVVVEIGMDRKRYFIPRK